MSDIARIKTLAAIGATRAEAINELGRQFTLEEEAAWHKEQTRRKVTQAKRRLDRARHKATNADAVAALVARRADIGPIPEVKDPERREACREDLPRFLKTYMPTVFTREFSARSLAFLHDVEERIKTGGRKAIAMPRGYGKTAMSIGATIWAALYAHRRYLVVVSATGPAALKNISDILAHITSEETFNDFPEVAYPISCLDGKTQRCKYQTTGGEPTRLEVKRDCIVFPSVGNESAGVTIQAASLTGAVRGMHRTDSAKQWIRPDFVLLDDPQTRESATSLAQTDERERIINGDIMGLAGHDTPISAIMACTVVACNDLSERFLSSATHPEWRGQRERMVSAWGGTADAWKEYDRAFLAEVTGETATGSAAAYFAEHEQELSRGSQILDDSLFGAGECSALQHARNLYLTVGEFAFAAEYQNEPQSLTPAAEYSLSRRDILGKVNGLGRGEKPEDAVKVVAAIDLNRYAAAWCVCASDIDGAISVMDYGWYTPRGKDELWRDGENREVGLACAVEAVVAQIFGDPRYGNDVSAICVDAGFAAQVVYDSVKILQRKHQHRRIIAARGMAGDRYFIPRSRKGLFQIGRECDIRRQYLEGLVFYWDSHYWHMETQKGWLLPGGVPGGCSLFGNTGSIHAQFADQACADELVTTAVASNGRTYAIWQCQRHNEAGDVLAMCAALASLGTASPSANAIHANAPHAVKAANRAAIAAKAEEARAAAAKMPQTRAAIPRRASSWAANW